MVINSQLKNLRRLTGASFLLAEHGAAAEADIESDSKALIVALWKDTTQELLNAVGWNSSRIACRIFAGGATLQISAPTDALFSAQDLVATSWEATNVRLAGKMPDIAAMANNLRTKIADELSPKEVSLATKAKEHGLTYLGHDDKISIGLGCGSAVYDVSNIPSEDEINWDGLHEIPIAMVTGTNGKSTTVRLSAAIGAAADKCVGVSSSDWVRVGGEILDEGDYSGPAGARLAVRDQRVELGIIETARGGLMRRGLPVPSADACLLTNIAADHLGSYGIMDVSALADAKFQLSQAVKRGGRLVLNNDDIELVSRSTQFSGDITWFGLNFEPTVLKAWIDKGGRAAFVEEGQMMLARDGVSKPVLAVADFLPALGGAAKFNIYNALGAIALTDALDLPIEAMAKGLAGFTDTPDENPGRGNYFKVGGLTLLIDFAHNPHGVRALADSVQSFDANRRLAIASQAGDRSDQDTRDLVQALWSFDLDAVIIAELPHMLRGRELGELTKVMSDEFVRLGADRESITKVDVEFEAVKKSLEWAQAGDFLALLVHEDLKKTLALIELLEDTHWQAGDPLPAQNRNI